MSFEEYWILVLLALTRTVVFIYFLPFFKSSSFPNMAKLAISLGIAIFAAQKMSSPEINNIPELFGMLFLEVLIGLILAFVVDLVVSIAKIAGSYIDLDIGLMNPFTDINQSQSTAISSIFYGFFVLIFLVTDGFNEMIAGYIYTFGFNVSPNFIVNNELLEFILDLFNYMFFGALQIALPFLMATFLVNLALLLMSKSVDKINILMNIFGIKIVVGLALIFVTIPTLSIALQQVDDKLLEKFFEVMNYIFIKES